MTTDLRKRGGVGDPTTHDGHQEQFHHDDHHSHNRHLLHDHHYLSITEFVLTIPYFLILGILAWNAHNSLPTGKGRDIEPSSFSASRARDYLQGITSVGPHPCGSYENDVITVNYLMNALTKIKAAARTEYVVDIQRQYPSGGFGIAFLDGFTNTYNNVTNIIVHLYSKGKTPEHNILVNAHFDSQFKTEGASDDAVSCAIMLEMLNCLAQSPPAEMKHGIVFLFNGAEESMLEAGHGFITQHPLAKKLRAFVNLEAAGSGGKEMVFQTGPEHPWLVQAYAMSAKYPYASVVAQEVFQSGIIPSDTDYRVFRDYGNIPGIDIAYSANGYVYHTRYDTADRIPDGSIQRAGENVLDVLRNLVKSPFVEDTSKFKHGGAVFFDILGQVMILYPGHVGFILNLSTVLIVLLYIVKQVVVKEMQHHKGNDHSELDRAKAFLVISSIFVTITSLLASLLVAVTLAFIITNVGKSMSWYSWQPYPIILYGTPCLFTIVAVHSAAKDFLPQCYKHASSVGHRQLERSSIYAQLILSSCGLIFMTYKGWLSSFCILLWLVYPFLGHCILYDQILHPKGIVWSSSNLLISHFAGHLIPALMTSYQLVPVYDVFIPIFGRLGSQVPSDVVISILAWLTVAVLSFYMISLVYTLRRTKKLLAVLGILSIIPFLFTITVGVFPFSSKSPLRPKRLVLQHIDRRFHNEKGEITQSDAGIWIIPLDILGISHLKPLQSAEPVTCTEYYCKRPFYYPVAKMVRKSWFLSHSPPPIPERPKLEVLKREYSDDHHVRLYFKVTGPDHMVLFITTKNGVDLMNWSLSKEGPYALKEFDGRNTYFVFHTEGYYSPPWTFWIEFSGMKALRNTSLADVAVAGHFVHGKASSTDVLDGVTKELPPWVVDSSWVSCYDAWVL